MSEEQQEEARRDAEENPDVITVVDRNGNTNETKIEQIEDINMNTNNNQNEEITTRKSSRIKSSNPIIRSGITITH